MENVEEKANATEEINENLESSENIETEVKDSVEDKLAKLEEEIKAYKDRWMRSVAEFDNYKKRNANIWQEAYYEGMADVLVKLLPVGDHLDMALSLGLDKKTEDGIILIRRKFDEILKGFGVEEINPVGEKFDPEFAEAIMQVEGEDGEESDTVKQVFQKGYKLKEKMVRYAKVSVVK